MNEQKQDVEAVKGAAEYVALEINGGFAVIMYEGRCDGGTTIQTCKSMAAAEKARIRWQKKENRAVLKSQGQI